MRQLIESTPGLTGPHNFTIVQSATVGTVGTCIAMAKDVNVLKVLKKDAQVRQKQSSQPSKPVA
jgi:hypothetical protein